MAIRIDAHISKKIGIPGVEFSSQQASITITSEVTDINQIVAESQRLYALAEQAVDQQLSAVPSSHSLTTTQPQTPVHRPTTSQPYPGQRRGASLISAAQMRYLNQLGVSAPSAMAAALAAHRVSTIDALSARDASQIIDHLKQVNS